MMLFLTIRMSQLDDTPSHYREPKEPLRAGTASIHQLADLHIERHRDSLDHGDGGIAHAAFHPGDIGSVQTGPVGELFLRPGFGFAGGFDVGGEALADIHPQ